MPKQSPESSFHQIALTGSKWQWSLLNSGASQELFRARIDCKRSWTAACTGWTNTGTEPGGPTRLVLTRQFNWPTGISADQTVRIAVQLAPKAGCQASLDGRNLPLKAEQGFLSSDPIGTATRGARQLTLSLDCPPDDSMTPKNPLRGVWLRIE